MLPSDMIRDAEPADASAIARIYNESIRARDSTMQLTPIEGDDVKERLRNLGAREAVLVVDDDPVIGYGMLKTYSDRGGYRYAGETSVYLQRSQTEEGLGTRVQARLIERARAYEYHHLVAKMWADNDRSRALHQKFGYDLVGVQQEIGYVDGEWQDVAILQKVL